MDRNHVEEFVSELIRRKARQLVGKAGINESEIEDVEQSLRADLLERMPKYDSSKADLKRFVKKVVRNCISNLLRERLAAKRGGGRTPVSLNEALDDRDEGEIKRADTIADDDDPHGKSAERQADLAELLEELPPDMRELCQLLTTMNITDAAEHLRTDRANLYRRVRQIRQIFIDKKLCQIE